MTPVRKASSSPTSQGPGECESITVSGQLGARVSAKSSNSCHCAAQAHSVTGQEHERA